MCCFQCVTLFMERQYSMFHGMSNRDDNGTGQRPSFHLKIDAVLYSCIMSFYDICFFWGMML